MAMLGVRRALRRRGPDPRASTTWSRASSSRTFEDSRFTTIDASTADAWLGLAVGGAISIAGIALAYFCYVRRPGHRPLRWPSACARCTPSCNKWYFDELYDALVYRPLLALGRFANAVFERFVVQGIVAAATASCGAPASVVRVAQSGLRARLRAAADRRASPPRPLLPGGEPLMGVIRSSSGCRSPAGARRCSSCRGGPCRAGRRRSGSLGGARARDRAGRRLRHRRRRAPARRRRVLDPRARHPLPARRRRDQPLPDPADRAAVGRGDAAGRRFAAPERRARRLYYFMLGLGETAALGAFLAQDLLLFVLFFDLMLVPFYFLIGTCGGDEPDRGDDEDDRLHAGRLAADAGRRDRHRDPRRGRSASSPSRSRRCSSTRCRPAARTGSSASSPPPSWSRCRPSRCTAGCRTPTAPRRCRCSPCSRACSRRSAPTASCASRCRSSRTPRSHFQELMLVIALASILYGSVMAFTQTNVRLIAGYSSIAQLGFITLGIFSLRPDGADGAVLQMVNHGLVVAAVFLIIALLYARAGTEDLRRDGRPGDARAGARGPVPDRHAGDAGDARAPPTSSASSSSSPASSRRRSSSRSWPRSASCWPPSTRSACTSARCTTGCPRAPSRARSALRDARRARAARRLHRRPRAVPGADPRAGRGLGDREGRRGRPRRDRSSRRARWREPMNFNAPHIDYAGLSPLIALTAGLVLDAAGRAGRRQPPAPA